jgi:hypothetical protein
VRTPGKQLIVHDERFGESRVLETLRGKERDMWFSF